MQKQHPEPRSRFLLGLSILILLAYLGVDRRQGSAAPAGQRAGAPGILVAFYSDISPLGREATVQRFGLEYDTGYRSRHASRLRIGPRARAAGLDLARALRILRSDPSVRLAEPDFPVHASALPNDPRFSQLWALHNTGQTGGIPDADIDWLEAWGDMGTLPGPVVAVLDTGVDYNHPDLRDNIYRDVDGAVVGWDFVNNDANPQDDHGHGTHVAGTIAARGNNGLGIIGVCPSARIMPLKFLDDEGTGATSDAIRAIDFAVASGAQIISNSWGGGGFSEFLLEAVQRAEAAGVLVVAAAGNDGTDNDAVPVYPAGYNRFAGNVLSVAASDSHDQLAGFSNYGRDTVDLCAPGVAIVSTYLNNAYTTMSGTSMATPHVSGAAAMILTRYPNLSIRQLKERLLNNFDQPTTLGELVPQRRLNVAKALVDDVTAPGSPAALTVSHFAPTGLLLTWTASGDDGAIGTASRYELHYSTTPLDAGNFNQAASMRGLPHPAESGTHQSFLLAHLAAGQDYYVALRAVDRVGNVSPLATLGRLRTPAAGHQQVLFNDDCEGAARFLGTQSWTPHTEQSWSPTRSYSDSPGKPYGFRTDSSLTQNAGVTLTGVVPVLSFFAKTDLEPGFDFVYIEVSTDDGSSWSRQELSLTGLDDWHQHFVPLGRYYGRRVRVRFRLISDEIINGQGIWLDDIRIAGDRLDPGAIPPPAAPTRLAVTSMSRDRVDLQWIDQSDSEAGFKVERRAGPTGFTLAGVVGTDVTTFSDTSVSANTVYYYRVRATNSGGDSAATSEVEAHTLPEPPPPPGTLVAQASDLEVTLFWSAAAGADGYRIYRGTTQGGPYLLMGTTAGAVSYVDGTVGTGIRYYFVATSIGAGGESVHSNEVAVTPGLVRPEPPTRIRARASQRRVTVTWKQSTSLEVVLNRIYRARAAQGPYQLIATIQAGKKFRDTRVSAAGVYYYRVSAVDVAGRESTPSEHGAAFVGRAVF